MKYEMPNDIKFLCEKESLKDKNEQERVKNELVNFLEHYLSLDEGEDKGNNSLANVTDIISKDGEFPIKGAINNYPFERDVAGRMMRTRNYTMQEGFNEVGKKEVYVIAADRDWWDKNKFWFSITIVLIGTLAGSISNPLSNFLNNLINGKDQAQELYRVKLQTNTPILHQADTIYNLEIEKMDSTQPK